MRLLKFLWWTCVTLICGVLLSFSGAYLYLSPSLPSVEALRNVQLQIPLKVYSEDGKLISEFGEMRRTPIRFADIPQDFIHALLSAEDDNFANHYGVDVKSLMRAAAQLLKSGHIQTGGSTITMQVAKNYFLTNERSFSRKINEILLALQIERQLTKDEILELYVKEAGQAPYRRARGCAAEDPEHAPALRLPDHRPRRPDHPHRSAAGQGRKHSAADLQRHRRQPGTGVPLRPGARPGTGGDRLRRSRRRRFLDAQRALPLSRPGQAGGADARLPGLRPGQRDRRVLGRRAGPAVRPRLSGTLQEADPRRHFGWRGDGAGQAEGTDAHGQPAALHPALLWRTHRPGHLRRGLPPRPQAGHGACQQGAFVGQAGLLLATVRRARLDQHPLAA
ncbi:penicillin-binding protein 1A [Pseudomonas aeruginosa VRFPA02]|nr:penicillin-binding protein 1A [Pseudomonas aeruginosa VRFPA02]